MLIIMQATQKSSKWQIEFQVLQCARSGHFQHMCRVEQQQKSQIHNIYIKEWYTNPTSITSWLKIVATNSMSKLCSTFLCPLETFLFPYLDVFGVFAACFLNAARVVKNWCFLNLLVFCLFARVFVNCSALTSQGHCCRGCCCCCSA